MGKLLPLFIILFGFLLLGGFFMYKSNLEKEIAMSKGPAPTLIPDVNEATAPTPVVIPLKSASTQERDTVIMTDNGNGGTTVQVTLSSGNGSQPAHIHEGSCDKVGNVVYPLEDVVNGESETTLKVPVSEIMKKKPLSVAVFMPDQITSHVACADIN